LLILALDTSDLSGSFSVLNGVNTIEKPLLDNEKTAQILIPQIKTMLESEGYSLADVALHAVATGPGSFTGIRIGLTTAKTFAYATKKKIIGINSLAAIAMAAKFRNFWLSGSITIVMNAFRKQMFWATFDFDDFSEQAFEANNRTKVVDQSDLFHVLNSAEQSNHLICGPGTRQFTAVDLDQFGERVLPAESFESPAIGVGLLAAIRANRNDFDDPIKLLPNYFRGSAAEEKLKIAGKTSLKK